MNRSVLRELLKENGIEKPSKELLDEIFTMNNEDINAERKKFEGYVSKEEFDIVQHELDALKSNPSVPEDYEELKQFKADTEQKELNAKKNNALLNLLKENKASDKALNLLAKAVDISTIEIAEDGSISNSEDIIKGLKSEYSDFFVVEKEDGANPNNNPKNDNSKGVTKEQFKKMSLAERSELAKTQPEIYNSLRGE